MNGMNVRSISFLIGIVLSQAYLNVSAETSNKELQRMCQEGCWPNIDDDMERQLCQIFKVACNALFGQPEMYNRKRKVGMRDMAEMSYGINPLNLRQNGRPMVATQGNAIAFASDEGGTVISHRGRKWRFPKKTHSKLGKGNGPKRILESFYEKEDVPKAINHDALVQTNNFIFQSVEARNKKIMKDILIKLQEMNK